MARRRKDKKKQDNATPGPSEGGEGGAASDAAGAEEGGPGGGLPAADAAQAELLELAKACLPVPYREDGPPLVRCIVAVARTTLVLGALSAAALCTTVQQLHRERHCAQFRATSWK